MATALGNFNPAPFKFGASKNLDLEAILEAVLESNGTAFSKDRESTMWVENHALARIIKDLFSAATRLENGWNPDKMVEPFISRFENILGIVPNPSDSEGTRRARIKARFSFLGKNPNYAALNDFLNIILKDIFVNIINTNAVDANSYVPDGAIVPGGGPVIQDGNTLTLGPWTSSTAYIAFGLEKPADMSDIEFYNKTGDIQLLDSFLPAWVTFDWFQDGDNGAGFYLDEENNLDNQRFD